MTLAEQARAVERDIFGALIGALAGVVACRVILLVAPMSFYLLGAIILIVAWSGACIAHVATNRSISTMDSIRSWANFFRSVCLRIMLWLLGAAAVLGVLAVLTSSFDTVGRVAGTAAITGLAAGVLLPCLNMLEQGQKWRVGLLGSASVFAAYLLGAPSIWEIGFRSEETAIAALIVAGMMPFGLAAMFMTHERMTSVAGWVGALLYVVSLTLFLCAVFDDHWHDSDEFIASGFSLLGFGSLAVACLVNVLDDQRIWRWIGVAAAALGATVMIYGCWTDHRLDEKWIITIASVGCVVAFANLALLAPLSRSQQWWRVGTIASGIVTAAAVDVEVFLQAAGATELTFVGRLALAAGILTSTGTLALVIFTRLNQSSSLPAPVTGPLTNITVHCPRCHRKQTIPLAESAHCQCGLSILVEVAQNGSQTDMV